MRGALPGDRKVMPGLWFIRSRSSDGALVQGDKPVTDFRPFAQEFEDRLNAVLSDLLDLQKPFEQTTTTEDCAYCAFKTMCGR